MQAIERNRLMRIELGLEDARTALAEARGKGRGRAAARRSSTQPGPQPKPTTRLEPIDLRSATCNVRGEGGPPQLKFARFAVRGLYQEVDEHLRTLLGEVFGHGGGDGLERSLQRLDEAPADGEPEKMVVMLYLGRHVVGCAIYRHPPPQAAASTDEAVTEICLLAISPHIIASAHDSASAPRAVAAALLAYVAVMAARNDLDKLTVAWAEPALARAAVQSMGECTPPALRCLAVDGLFFLQLEMGMGQTQSEAQTSYLLANVRAAEAALAEFACSTSDGGPAGRTVGGLPLAVGELIVLWEDKSTLSTVSTSQHYLAALAGERAVAVYDYEWSMQQVET